MNNIDEIRQDLQLTDNLCRTCMNLTNGIKSLFDYIEIGNRTFQLKFLLLKCTSIEVFFSPAFSIQKLISKSTNF